MRTLGSKNVGTAQRRSEILQAALRVFLRHGLLASTVDHILKEAEVSKGSLYHHFESKEGLAAALYIDTLVALQTRLLGVLEGEASAERGIKRFVRSYVEWFVENPDEGRFLFLAQGSEALEAYADEFRHVHGDFLTRSFEWVEVHVKRGAIRPLQRDLYVPFIIGPSRDYVRSNLRDAKRLTKDAALCLADVAWNTVREGAEARVRPSPVRGTVS